LHDLLFIVHLLFFSHHKSSLFTLQLVLSIRIAKFQQNDKHKETTENTWKTRKKSGDLPCLRILCVQLYKHPSVFKDQVMHVKPEW